MTNSTQTASASIKRRFIDKMNLILEIRDEKTKQVCIKTKENHVGYYTPLTDYLDFLANDADKIGNIKIEDILEVGYVPKGKEHLAYMKI